MIEYMKEYTTTEKIGMLYEMSIKSSENSEINKLLDKFNEDDMELINKACEINFRIGFRVATELLK